MICNIADNQFYIKVKNNNENLLGIDNIYINSIYNQVIKFRFIPKIKTKLIGLAEPEFIKFDLNRPSDDTIIETKIYF